MKISFNCELCGKERSEPECWFKKRQHHFCSRLCANRFNSKKRATGLTRAEYEQQYWAIPENSIRRKEQSKLAYQSRVAKRGDSAKLMILNRAKDRSKRKEIPFNITIDDFDIPDVCPILGINLVFHNKQGGSPNSPSLDKIVPSLGYVKGNVIVISKRANSIKNDASLDEILRVANWLKQFSSQPEDQPK